VNGNLNSIGDLGSPVKQIAMDEVASCAITDNLEDALEQFRNIYEDLQKT